MKSESHSVVSDSLQLHGLLHTMEFSRPDYWSGQPFPSSRDLPNPGIEPRSPALQADSLPAEPPGKPKNTGVGSLFLLQRTFLTQESNQSLRHCRRIFLPTELLGNPVDFQSSSIFCHPDVSSVFLNALILQL